MLFLVAERHYELKQSKQVDKIMELASQAAVESNKNPRWDGLRVAKVAQQYLKFGDKNQANTLLQKALEMTRSMEGDQLSYARKDTLRQIAIGFGMLGKKNKAKALFDEAQKYDQNPNWHYISEDYLEAGLFENALEAAKKERSAENKSTAFSKIAVAMAKKGMRERSLKIFSAALQSIGQKRTDKMTQNTVSELLASDQLDNDLLSRIDQLIHGIEDAGMRHRFLTELAVAYHGVGLTEKALPLLAEALTLADRQKLYDQWTIISYAKIGKVEQALSLARAQKSKDSISEPLGEIAAYLTDQWSPESVDALIEEALQVEGPAIEPFEESSHINNLFNGVIRKYLQLGNKKRAAEVLDRMVDHLSKRNIALDRSLLRTIGSFYLQAGHRAKATQYLKQALEKNKLPFDDERTVQRSYNRADISAGIADKFAKMGEYETAISILNEIDPQFLYEKSSGRLRVAETLIDAGEAEKATALLSEVFQVVMNASQAPKVWFLSRLGTQLFRVGKIEETKAVLSKMENSDVKAKLLIKVSEYYFDHDQKQQAVLFLKKINTKSAYGEFGGRAPLLEIARLWEKYGDQKQAQHFRDQEEKRSHKSSDTSTLSDREDQVWIAVFYAKAGFYDEAFEIAQSRTENFLKGVNWIFGGGMWQVIYYLIEGEEFEKASTLLSNAVQLIPKADSKATFKAPLLQRIAASYIQMGKKEKALKLLDQAFSEAEKMPRGATYRTIGDSYLEVGKREKAFRAYFKAVHLLRTPSVNWVTAIDLGSISLSLMRTNTEVDAQTIKLLHNIIFATGI